MKICTLASLQVMNFDTVEDLLVLRETVVAKFDELVDELAESPSRETGEKVGVMLEFITKAPPEDQPDGQLEVRMTAFASMQAPALINPLGPPLEELPVADFQERRARPGEVPFCLIHRSAT